MRDSRPWIVVGIVPALIVGGAALACSLLSQERTEAGAAPYRFSRARESAPEREIAFLEERVRRSPDDGLDLALLAGAYAAQARRTNHSGEYLRAEKTALRSLEKLPFHNEGARLVLGRVAEARHEFGRAIEIAREVLRARPAATDARGLLITSLLAIGRLEEAMGLADELVDRSPRQGAYALRALVLAATGRDAEAKADFEHALAVEDVGEFEESARTRMLLARFHLRRGNAEAARALLQRALQLIPGAPMAHGLLAEVCERSGDWEGASRHLALAAADSHDPIHLVHGARIRKALGDLRGAEALYDEAEAKIRAENGFGHRLALVRLLLQRARPADRIEALRLAREESAVRRSAEALDLLAWAQLASGQPREARKAVQEALQTGSRDPALFSRAAEIDRALGLRPLSY